MRISEFLKFGTICRTFILRKRFHTKCNQTFTNTSSSVCNIIISSPSDRAKLLSGESNTGLNVITKDGGTVESVDVWGRRRLAYEVKKNAEGIYAVISLNAEPDTVTFVSARARRVSPVAFAQRACCCAPRESTATIVPQPWH